MAIADTLLAIPRLVLLLVCAALWQPGLGTVIIVLVATGWMGVARLIRAEVLGVRALPYVDSAVSLGAASWRVLWRHTLPNALGPAIVATLAEPPLVVLLGAGAVVLDLFLEQLHALLEGLSCFPLGARAWSFRCHHSNLLVAHGNFIPTVLP